MCTLSFDLQPTEVVSENDWPITVVNAEFSGSTQVLPKIS